MRPLRPCLRLLCPRLAWHMGLIVLIGLSACGPAPSDHAPSLEPHTSVGGPSESPPVSQNSPSSHNNPVTPAASPVPLASNHAPVPLPNRLVSPDWAAQALASTEVPVRLRALDMWAQQGSNASLDPVVMALEDGDDDERMKAMIEEQEKIWGEWEREGR